MMVMMMVLALFAVVVRPNPLHHGGVVVEIADVCCLASLSPWPFLHKQMRLQQKEGVFLRLSGAAVCHV